MTKTALAVAVLCVLCLSLNAAPIYGTFGMTSVTGGVLVYQTAGPTMNFIDFSPTGGSSGTFNVTTATSGLSGLAGAAGTILDMTDYTPPNAGFVYFPVGIPVAVNNYLAFAAAPGSAWNFQGNYIYPQACAPSATQYCTGGFMFNQIGPNVSVSVAIAGTLNPGVDQTGFDLILTAQYVGTSMATVLANAQTPGGANADSWSGSFSSVPEPGTVTLIGAGLGLLAFGGYRRRKK
ncbi:MAG: PEP-CTERM sorting domain-containing protein [Acidobacteria bacterium]|nr:PEP-CTERM sorting domain-containing protein [Acidobacteriota bacterium]